MCTATLVRIDGGFRLVTSRDESPARPDAIPPRWRDLGGGRQALFPVDPLPGGAEGTWVAATSHGLVLCLLNMNPTPPIRTPHRSQLVSRGTIIPKLLGCAGAAAAADALSTLDLGAFAPFRLLAVEPAAGGAGGWSSSLLACWDRSSFSVRAGREEEGIDGALCLVSSGLGDHRVLPRRALFDEMVGGPAGSVSIAGAQDTFHRHRWDDRPEISVLMDRGAARTVSITTVEVTAGSPARVEMLYEPVPAGALGMSRR